MKNSYANNSSLKFSQMTDSVSRLYDAYLLDLDGTVLLGDSLILGAAKAIKFLKSQNKRVVFISNNSTSTAASYAQKLTSLGLPTENDDVINSSMVLINFLNENIPNGRLLVIGETALCKTGFTNLSVAGLPVVLSAGIWNGGKKCANAHRDWLPVLPVSK